MKIIRKTNILVKTKREYAIRRENLTDETILCPQCGAFMLDAQTAANALNVSVRQIYRLVEANKIHFYETGEKIGLVCLKSIREDAEAIIEI